MKKTYISPEISVTEFTTEDIITASSAGLNMHADVLDATYIKGNPLSSGSWE